jgi:UDP-2,3-diacylglucosamine pyrophosphatase LpxH
MLAVISDLHFEEEASDVIPGNGRHPDLVFCRNLDPRAYRHFIAQMAEQVEERKIKTFELVIAGDLFDFNRTVLWFQDDLRPYVSLPDIKGPLENKILKILEATAAEKPVKEALEAFRLLCEGRYITDEGKKRDFPAKTIRIHYITGNHDRLSNATPAIRKRIREMLGLKDKGSFPHYVLVKDPAVLIRHGHEYDRNNFSLDPEKTKTIPLNVPEDAYARPNFGDFVTVDIAVRLPYLFRKKYGDQQILADPVMSSLYLRLLQFDDVRPQSALLDYMLDTSSGDYSAEEAWERLVPVIQDLLDEIHDNKFFHYWLKRRARPWAPAELEAARGLLKVGGWRNRIAREAGRKIAHFMMGGDTDEPQLLAQLEEVIQSKQVRLVVAGHTHHPEVCLIGSDQKNDRFYVNTGTWRNRIPSTPDERTFGRIKALTYLMLFSSSEDRQGNTCGAFDFWSGYTKHFF